MKRKPWSLIILALLHILAPIGNFFINAIYSGRGIEGQWNFWFHALPKEFLLLYVALPMLAGVFIFICKQWSYWAYLVCLAALLVSNAFSYWTQQNLAALAMLITLLVIDLIVVAYFVVPSVQRLYFDPRLRWWEAAPRYNFGQKGMLNGHNVHIKNMSFGGLFMSSDTLFKEGDVVEGEWTYEDQTYQAKGQVVYKMPGKDGPGYGVKFEHTPESEKALKKLNTRLHSQGLIVKERLPGPDDAFLPWLKKLVTTGQGLIPKLR